MKLITLFILLILASLPLTAFPQVPSGHSPGGPPMHGTPREGPYTHQIESASSKDGLNWTYDHLVIEKHASVPTAVVTESGSIMVYFVDFNNGPEEFGCMESTDQGKSYQRRKCEITYKKKPVSVDFSIMRRPHGGYNLYYYGFEKGQLMASGDHSIYLAESHDGINFREMEKPVFSYPGLVDPDVFFTGKKWLMYVFAQGIERKGGNGTIVAESPDGNSFTYVGRMNPTGFGTTAAVKIDNGQFRLYGFEQPTQKIVRSFVSTDGIAWTMEDGIRIEAEEGREITDPFVIKLRDGTWKMIFKTSPEQQKRGMHKGPPQ